MKRSLAAACSRPNAGDYEWRALDLRSNRRDRWSRELRLTQGVERKLP